MDADRLRRATWNWLPVFVEIAEQGSVVAAARRLALTPAAVSRTLSLLEASIGEPLFARVGRRIVLNPAGARLRDEVRASIGVVERGLASAMGRPLAGPVRVASSGVITDSFAVPALIALRARHPELVPIHQNVGAAEALAQLTHGALEVALFYEPLTVEAVEVTQLGATPCSVYVGRGHALFAVPAPRRAEVLAHAFSVPQIGDGGRVLDGWPAAWPRKVGMRITLLRSNLDVCRSGQLLTVLPDVTAAPSVAAGELRRVLFDPLPPIDVYAAWARGSRHDVVPIVVEEVRAQLLAANTEAQAQLAVARPGRKGQRPGSVRKPPR